ncbi:MAG: Rieske (2Fe-2S) protein [Chloroherpetonaceae bacterium]|nr:Rieske (2Fe-2S) protein [Chloroherpetonaceae bacterium]MCS7211321.1 Rieske (2Fe-2S) protein [Chloroherpetonaceae bacterium]MDW8020282.1 Rieske (2Fe-2S) protein [Chloroherpetonaceae bacterium]MDW8466527.1 Rieske (2Fe-2S) protein [Chloroherpetonaceae bacterium]
MYHLADEPKASSIGAVSRRAFLEMVAASGSMLACGTVLSSLLAACSSGSGGSATDAPLTGAREQLNIANVPQLQTVGGFLRRVFQGRNNNREVLIVRVAQNEFRAASVVCTHAGCNVENPQGSVVTCLCHGSRFSIAANNFGAVLNGPATSPLQTFPTSFDGTTLTITF